ncbi:N-formylglutamate deformylase [Primorskyibacter sp. S87]|uniref:N-formylglutamate deformylase n=1 Tax=Primorskyibacter sp. S87 TaxID=3415126 RepID=UPI003C7A13E0
MNVVSVTRRDGPIVLGRPHGGTWLPDELLDRLTPRGQGLADTDWHINRLYDGLLEGATVVQSNVHRYAIDANRDPAGVSLYPGQNTTTLCPLTDFDGVPIWKEGQTPSEDEILSRRDAYHVPYHAALGAELERVRALHGVAILFDCHSIRSEIPFLFEGRLPVFSIGTNGGETCAPAIETITADLCRSAKGYDCVLNGRFKGGWTTRHYGRPQDGIHAIQMELAQRAYLSSEAPPWAFDDRKATRLRAHLGAILAALSSGDMLESLR